MPIPAEIVRPSYTSEATPDLSALTCWVVTEGFAGMENQCVGLAEALGITCEAIHVARPHWPWKLLPPVLWSSPLTRVTKGVPLEPPWPDILISSGRGSVAAVQAIRRASQGKTFAVHIQTPYVAISKFDLVVIPQHDVLRGENIVVVDTALHRVTKDKLQNAAQHFAALLRPLPRPLIAVLVGGSNRRKKVSGEIMIDFADKLAGACRKTNGGLAITPSRRTGPENEKILRARLQDLPALIWDGTGENPYFGLLALADAIVVTGDSISMISEACSTGKPVYIYNIGDDSQKMRHFHQSLYKKNMARPFIGEIESWPYTPVNETEKVAAAVREYLVKKFTKYLES